jgi:hypothetical protein
MTIEKKIMDAVNRGDRDVMKGLLYGCFGDEARDFFVEICVGIIGHFKAQTIEDDGNVVSLEDERDRRRWLN